MHSPTIVDTCKVTYCGIAEAVVLADLVYVKRTASKQFFGNSDSSRAVANEVITDNETQHTYLNHHNFRSISTR